VIRDNTQCQPDASSYEKDSRQCDEPVHGGCDKNKKKKAA